MRILNIAAGKFDPLSLTALMPYYILNIDTSYFSETKVDSIESSLETWEQNPDRITTKRYLNMDAFEFMERTRIMFDRVVLYRFLEHVSFTQVEYFIYLISTILKPGGMVDVIVPNYTILAEMILNEEGIFEGDPCINLEAHNIILTTELLNEPSCPHASIWTPARMKYFWELEKRFKISTQEPVFKFDGRDIYMRAIMERI